MKTYSITFINEQTTIQAKEGTTLLDAQIQAGLAPDAPCGGAGTCGKCTVNILSGQITGIQKACSVKIYSDMEVLTSHTASKHRILTSGTAREIRVNPMVRSFHIKVAKCQTGESSSDWERLLAAIYHQEPALHGKITPNLSIAANLYDTLKSCDYDLHTILCGQELLSLSKEPQPFYLTAFDIGTTTIVGYLLDGRTGEELAVASTLNPQTQYGADVIMRSNHALSHGTEELSSTVRKAVNQLIHTLCQKAAVHPEDIMQVSVVGNTCMHHLFLGISPGALVHAPYNPTISDSMILTAKEYDIHIHPAGKLMVLPVIAGFVGADTVGCLLASEFDKKEQAALMIDIGTNGELVIGNKDRMLTCSTAAGPAFEGAKITCGMRGAAGAIDHVFLKGNELSYTTIGNEKPAGICGSGLMDLTAVLLRIGMIDETGRILDDDELESDAARANAKRIIEIENRPAILLEEGIFLTQKDVREIQLAKGAMAAGIELMCEHLHIQLKDIQEVLIAGAFGNYMSPESACTIGLIPSALQDRIHPIGNAAGEGAKLAILSAQEYTHAQELARRIEFLELATDPEFQDCFVDNLEFPEF